MKKKEYDLTKQGKLTWINVAQFYNAIVLITEKQRKQLQREPLNNNAFLRECHFRNLEIKVV